MKKTSPNYGLKSNRKAVIFALILIGFLFFDSCSHGDNPFTTSDVKRAQHIVGIDFSQEVIDTILPYLKRNLEGYDSMRSFEIDREVMPAILFNPLPRDFILPVGKDRLVTESPIIARLPSSLDSLCFYPISHLATLIHQKKISSTELTRLFLERIKKYDRILHSFITITEDLALSQAKQADEDLAEGRYRGPLHGIPYGIKDLIAVKGYPTTWGGMPYQHQKIDYTASVAQKLEKAGAILLGKLSSGALARGDVWFDARTVSPWDTLMGAGGSSAGSASATAAGLVSFAIGTETLGSITMPSGINGLTGLRPTYGTVSRHGVMSLSWSMDKIGPICRSAEDCAIVFAAIHGKDILDPTTYDTPFSYDDKQLIQNFRIGILKNDIESDTSSGAPNLKQVLAILDSLQLSKIEKKLPVDFPFNVFDIILRSESGAYFDELVRSGQVDLLVQQDESSRANSLRQSRFIPAVEYIQANRHRTRLIEKMHEFMKDIDVLIAPPSAQNQLLITNLTGHPALAIPVGLDSLKHPVSMTIIGQLFEEDKLLEFGHALQKITDFHKVIPPLFKPDEDN
ncbi:MAG: amidase [Saprospiraceae bacterium]|nr:amidase [Saprospiraceae bacterium]